MANLTQFQKVPVEVQKRNGFDISHRASGTATCGTLIPVLSKFLIPSTEINLNAVMQVDFPPFATDFKGRINASIETFFVPNRLAFAGWKTLIKQGINGSVLMPWVVDSIPEGESVSKFSAYFGSGSLADYFGVHPVINQAGAISWYFPFVSYGLIYNYWYRNKNVQTPLYDDNYDNNNPRWIKAFLLSFQPSFQAPYQSPIGNVNDVFYDKSATWNDGSSFFDLRQRNYPKDYFTAAFPNAMVQASGAIKVDTSQGDAFAIAQFRAANSATLFLERYMMAGSDYDDIMFANYGIRPSDAAINHPLYLGRIRSVVYNRYVDNNNGDSADAGSTRNPLAGVIGGAGARGNVAERGQLCKNFTVTEHGYIMCLFSIWPDAQYNEGTRRDVLIADITHIPWPLLQSVGYDSIYNVELYGAPEVSQGGAAFDSFAYAERYAWYKFEKDHVNGLLRPGASLSSFALQRTFNGLPQFGSSFLQVNKSDMDNVFAVSQSQSGFACWYDIYFTMHISTPLAAYCIPTLGEPKDARTVWIENGGHML